MSVNLARPVAFTIRTLSNMEAFPLFDPAPKAIDVARARIVVLRLLFQQDVGAPLAFPRMRMRFGDTSTTIVNDVTIDNASAPLVVPGVGLATAVDTSLKDFQPRTFQQGFVVDVSEYRWFTFEFSEVGQGATPSLLQVDASLVLEK